jgi:hypothetical protein
MSVISSEIDLSLFKWCDQSAIDELEEKTENIEVLGYEDFLKIPVTEQYEKNKAIREERIKKDIEEAKKQAEESNKKSNAVFDTINFTEHLELD